MNELEKQLNEDFQRIKHEVEMAYSIYPPLAASNSIDNTIMDNMVMDGSAVFTNEDAMIQSGLRLAWSNQLNLTEIIDMDVFNAMGEDNIKSKSKIDMSLRIASEITAKTKFTMAKEQHKVTVRAKLYAFTEAEMTAFIERILKIAK
jgi:hypothetical protein